MESPIYYKPLDETKEQALARIHYEKMNLQVSLFMIRADIADFRYKIEGLKEAARKSPDERQRRHISHLVAEKYCEIETRSVRERRILEEIELKDQEYHNAFIGLKE